MDVAVPFVSLLQRLGFSVADELAGVGTTSLQSRPKPGAMTARQRASPGPRWRGGRGGGGQGGYNGQDAGPGCGPGTAGQAVRVLRAAARRHPRTVRI